MARFDTDPTLAPRPVRLAQPLIDPFVRSAVCPPHHRWHARSTLPVLALFVAMMREPDDDGLAWEALAPDALVAASIEADPTEHAFLRDLLDVSASFYRFLGDQGVVSAEASARIRVRLAHLALGFGQAA